MPNINDSEYVKRLLDCARECRAVAVILTDAALKADYLTPGRRLHETRRPRESEGTARVAPAGGD